MDEVGHVADAEVHVPEIARNGLGPTALEELVGKVDGISMMFLRGT
jgi:hypothetical protein